jgi:hypothetical protein
MIPDHLQTTLELLQRAFPDGIGDSEYIPLLSALYPHMADENLARIIAEYTQRDIGVVLNDILAEGNRMDEAFSTNDLVQARLSAAGFERWIADDD